jgi:hypothetical protein
MFGDDYIVEFLVTGGLMWPKAEWVCAIGATK